MHAVERSGLEPICRGCNFAIDPGENRLIWKTVSNKQRNYSNVVSIHDWVSCILNAVDHSNETLKLAKEAVRKFNESEALKTAAIKFDDMEFLSAW